YMFITDGRFITGPYRDWHKNNSFDAGTQWAVRYGNYRNAYAAMKLINSTSALTAGEKAGALGVLKTFVALDLLHVIEARDSIAAVASDDRYRHKVALATSACGTAYPSPQTEVGVTATHRACTYPTNVTSIPIIRNEELVLLRAEARWFTTDNAGATADLAR